MIPGSDPAAMTRPARLTGWPSSRRISGAELTSSELLSSPLAVIAKTRSFTECLFFTGSTYACQVDGCDSGPDTCHIIPPVV